MEKEEEKERVLRVSKYYYHVKRVRTELFVRTSMPFEKNTKPDKARLPRKDVRCPPV